MSNKEKVLEVKEDKIIIKKLGCDYSLLGYIPKPLENAVSSLVPFGQGEKEITYDEKRYYVNQILVAKESVAGGLLRRFFQMWNERTFTHDEYIRIDFDSNFLIKRKL